MEHKYYHNHRHTYDLEGRRTMDDEFLLIMYRSFDRDDRMRLTLEAGPMNYMNDAPQIDDYA